MSMVILKNRGEKWEFFFTEETQLLRTERKTESENRSYITTNIIFDLERDHQGRLKLQGERFLRNRILESQNITQMTS